MNILKTTKKLILSCFSVLIISCLLLTIFLLNPGLSYANKTKVDFVTIYHNGTLDAQTETIVKDAIRIVKKSKIFDDELSIDLCFNDDKIYPHLHPLIGKPFFPVVGKPAAYALLNKTIIKNCKPIFNENVAEMKWAVNNYELRKFNLTSLLAHEFTHNLQNHANFKYYLKNSYKINWKLEGHADYISREFQKDGKLKEKLAKYLLEEQKEQDGLPVFKLEDGTIQILPYFKYSLVIQYLMEEKGMSFNEICSFDVNLETVYEELIEWSKN